MKLEGNVILINVILKKDIANEFKMPNLHDTILDIKLKDGYIVDEHYNFFIVKKTASACKNVIKKTLFLTYEGIIRLLYVSHSPNAKYIFILVMISVYNHII